MSQFDDKIAFLSNEAAGLGIKLNSALFAKVAKGLGPSLYNDDASKVASSDPDELQRVKDKFLSGKLGVTNNADMDNAIADAITQMGSSNRNKYRAIFYYLLVVKLGKADVYKD